MIYLLVNIFKNMNEKFDVSTGKKSLRQNLEFLLKK